MKCLLKINIVAGLLILCIWSSSVAQVLKPVKWSYAFKKTSSKEGSIYLKADIDPGWHIYSVNQPDGGPVKTSFQFDLSTKYSLIGNPTEPKPIKHYEKVFGINVFYFERSVIFQQKIKLTPSLTEITGTLTFMVCNDHQCLPPEDIDFKIPVN